MLALGSGSADDHRQPGAHRGHRGRFRHAQPGPEKPGGNHGGDRKTGGERGAHRIQRKRPQSGDLKKKPQSVEGETCGVTPLPQNAQQQHRVDTGG